MAKFNDRELLQRAIDLSRACTSEPGKPSPKVGVVIARDGEIIGEGYRGELKPGEHGEFTVMERKLQDELLTGGIQVAGGYYDLTKEKMVLSSRYGVGKRLLGGDS